MGAVTGMNGQQFIFFISIALQVSGALILIVFCWGNTERRVLNTIFPANTSVHREEDDTVIICKEKLFKAHKEILLNRYAFIFIGAGYLLNLFGENEGFNPWIGLAVVIVGSVVIGSVGVLVAHLYAKCCNRCDKRYKFDDLCSKLDNDITTNYTDSEIDEGFEV